MGPPKKRVLFGGLLSHEAKPNGILFGVLVYDGVCRFVFFFFSDVDRFHPVLVINEKMLGQIHYLKIGDPEIHTL